MNHHISYQKIGKLSAAFVLLLPIILYGWRASLRPSINNQQKELFKGINYQKKHILLLDLL